MFWIPLPGCRWRQHLRSLGTRRFLLKVSCGGKPWATGWTIGVLGFDSRRRLGIFLFITASRTAVGSTQPPIQWVTGALSLGVKRPGREADHSPPPSAEVKEWVELYLLSPNTPPWQPPLDRAPLISTAYHNMCWTINVQISPRTLLGVVFKPCFEVGAGCLTQIFHFLSRPVQANAWTVH
jgi:hypothetical protein